MADIVLDSVSKVYPNGVRAVECLDLTISDGEFMVLVGPSGCGKTTVLRMMAGLEQVTSGAVSIGGIDVTHAAPRNRDIAMVFQNYALYPHMNVRDNISFGLRQRHVDKREVRGRVDDAARLLGLAEVLDRRPSQLSGGQRQRVAMGRAIVRRPAAFLMDEPLSNLDAKLRVQMRTEVTKLQRAVGVATVYVTHDQIEAMTMGDRVAVMNGGVLQQCDPPQVLYDSPTNVFVAAFVGSPAMNLYKAHVELSRGDGASAVLRIGDQTVPLEPDLLRRWPEIAAYASRHVTFGIRPEHVHIGRGNGPSTLPAQVELVESLGTETLVHYRITGFDAGTLPAALHGIDEAGLIEAGKGVARVAARTPVRAGDAVPLVFDVSEAHVFDPDSGRALGRGDGPSVGAPAVAPLARGAE